MTTQNEIAKRGDEAKFLCSRKPMNGLKKPKQILFRATSSDEAKIRQAAKLRGVSLQKFLLDAAIAATGN